MPALAQPRYSPEEYLVLERKAEYKSEYVDGRIFAMAGPSRKHNRITLNLASQINEKLRGRQCEAYSNDMRVRVPATSLYAYPDIVAVCGEQQLEDSHLDTLLNPTVIVEVLSASTEAYDRGIKFAHYRRLAALQEYVLVSLNEIRIEHYARRGEQWVLTEISDSDGMLRLASIGAEVLLRDIYDKVQFESENTIAEG
jgi:Uma2 family endonuclease